MISRWWNCFNPHIWSEYHLWQVLSNPKTLAFWLRRIPKATKCWWNVWGFFSRSCQQNNYHRNSSTFAWTSPGLSSPLSPCSSDEKVNRSNHRRGWWIRRPHVLDCVFEICTSHHSNHWIWFYSKLCIMIRRLSASFRLVILLMHKRL